MEFKSIHRVLIVGSGTMGLRIGLQSAISGYDTTVYDREHQALQSGQETARALLERFTGKGQVAASEAHEIWKRIHWSHDLPSAAKGADFVSESITEDLIAKITLWKELSSLVSGEAVLTTNTSYLLPSQLVEHVQKPDRFCAFHFHDVFWANVVDVMPHEDTDPAIIDLLVQLGKRLNQTPVVLKTEHSGYLFNHILIALLGAAGNLLANDIASIEDIDKSWMGNFKMPIGPFGMLDEVGLDTAWHIIKVRPDKKSQRFAELLKSYVDAGKLGVKTREGFYTYPHPVFKNPDFLL